MEHRGDELVEWPSGRSGETEVALVDAVMSIRARYGRPERTHDDVVLVPTGVHRAVAGFRGLRGAAPLNDLRALAALDAVAFQRALGSQKTGGVLKAEAIVRAAEALTAVGVLKAADLQPTDKAQKRAYTSVRGLGWVTWDYLGMLLGRPGVKADRWVIQAVEKAVRRQVSPPDDRDIVMATAADIGEDPRRLEHALWAFERTRNGR